MRGGGLGGLDRFAANVGLRFPDAGSERAFRTEYNATALPQVRLAGVISALMYGVFGVLDAMVAPDDLAELLLVRGGVIAYIVLAVLLTYVLSVERLDGIQQLAVCSVVVVANVGLAAMAVIADVPPAYSSTGTMLTLTFLFSLLRVRVLPALVTAVIAVVVYEISAVFDDLSWTTAAYNNFFLLGFVIAGAVTAYSLERLRRREFLYEQALRSAFGRYVSDDLIDQVAASSDAAIAGTEVQVTVLFIDIRGFTTHAERSTPLETVRYLNDFYEVVLPLVRAHGGHVNKLLGDGLLACFGAPVPLEDHADRALAAAIAVLAALDAVSDLHLPIGIGISSGTVVAGTVGDAGKLDYTLIGDPVNVASRVEQLTKTLGDRLLLTADTVALLRRTWPLEPRGEHEVRGKAAAVVLHTVRCGPADDPAALRREDRDVLPHEPVG